MKTAKTILFLVFLCSITTIVSAQINVNDNINEADLVGILTNNNPCVNTYPEIPKGDDFTGKNSYGSFDKDISSFPFAKGIVLSTWSAENAKGPYDAGNEGGGSASWLGDTDLNDALNITTSVNATSLEFDFIPITNFISFNYIFASNEYQYYYPCEYSDAFAFLIRNEDIIGSKYENLAVIPGAIPPTPVSSKNIHPLINNFSDNGVIRQGCQPKYEKYFNGFNTTASPINYSGQTVVMNAQKNVIAGNKYHIKLVIADDKNEYFDSAVFLEAGSFSPKIDLGPHKLLETKTHACFDEVIKLDTKLTDPNNIYKWLKLGSTTPIGTNSTLSVTEKGTYKVEATLPSGCIATGQIKIEYAPEIILKNATLNKCDDTGIGTATFDLTNAESEIKNNNLSLTKVAFYKTKTGTILSDLIPNPTSFIKTSPTDEIVYALTTSIYGCTNNAELSLQSLPSSLISGVSHPDPIINAFSGNKNSVELIPPTTLEPYEYSLDGTNYQSLALFPNLSAGEYTAYIRNSSTCEYLTYPFIILDFPRFFTPNNDGYNDTWKIKNIESFPKAIITIFDRYGNLWTQINTINSEWNGKFNGYELPADDYWFILDFGEGKVSKGHFSLKR
jgi:gliding motility-associated-like protein